MDFLNALAALEKPDGVIGFPTDTVYGLGCLVDHPQAIEKIYRLKGREEQKPLILLGKDRESLIPFISCTAPAMMARALELMEAHWPGALTLIFPKSPQVPDAVTRGGGTIGIRVPQCSFFLDFLNLTPQGVLATTSANLSGLAPCLTADCVHSAFGGDLDALLKEDGCVSEKCASTVVALASDGSVQVLRSGSIVVN